MWQTKRERESIRSVVLEMEFVTSILERTKKVRDIRVFDRFAGIISDQVLFGHIGHVKALFILSEQVIERLLLRGAAFLWNCLIPFFGIVEFRVHVEHHSPERVFAVPNDLADVIFCALSDHGSCPLPYTCLIFAKLSNCRGDFSGNSL